jgi:hypothetical protein
MSAVIASEKRALIVGVMRLWSGIGGIRMAENKMSQVAEMFGKKLGEEFILLDENKETYRAEINKNGLRVHGMYRGFWEHMLFKLIVGTAVIKC